MKRLLFILSLFVSVISFAQNAPIPYNSPWYEYNRKLSVNERFRLPLDTTSQGTGTARDTSGLIAYKNGKVYYLNNSVWTEVGTGALSGDTLYVINGPSSASLDTLARVPVSGDSLIIKSVGLQAGTFVSVTKSVGIDSIKWVAGLDTASAVLKAYIAANSGSVSASGLPSFYDGQDTAQINWRNIRNWYQEFADASNGQISYLSGDSARIVIAAEDSLVIGRAGDNSITKFRNIHPSGDSVLHINSSYELRNKLLNLNALSDVTITSAIADQYLKYNGTNWVNATPAEVYPIRDGDSIRLTNGIDTTSGVYAPVSISGGGDWSYGGNAVGADTSIGTTDNFALLFKTNGIVRGRFLNSGFFVVGQNSAYNSGAISTPGTMAASKISAVSTSAMFPTGTGSDGYIVAKSNLSSSTDYLLSLFNSADTRVFSVASDGTLTGSAWNSITSTLYRAAGTQLNIRAANSGTSTANGAVDIGLTTAYSSTSGSPITLNVSGTFSPSSGSASMTALKVRPQINQTGTSSGTMFGIDIDPQVTSLLGRNVGLRVASGETILQSVQYRVQSATGAYNVTAQDYTITADATTAAFNVTLPTAVGITGKVIVVKKTDSSANAVTVATTSSQTIDGNTTYSLPTQYKYVMVQSNGSNWIVIGNN